MPRSLLALVLLVLSASGCIATAQPRRPVFAETFVGAEIEDQVELECPADETGELDSERFHGLFPRRPGCVIPRVTAVVTCNLRCRTVHDPDDMSRVTIIPLEPGHLEYELRGVRGKDEYSSQKREYEVYPPARIELWCGAQADARANPTFQRCGDQGVSAAFPLLKPRLYGRGADGPSTQMVVNGKLLAMNSERDWFSLADVFPANRVDGGGVTPGRYDVELAIGSVTTRWAVAVR